MKYIILNKKTAAKSLEMETNKRIKYIAETLKLYMVRGKETDYKKGFVSLEPIFLKDDMDYFFIFGHNGSVYNYIVENIDRIKEKNLVLICCSISPIDRLKIKGKNIYVSKNKKGITDCFNGNEWGFDFDVCFSEIDLYNNRKMDIKDNIEKSFDLFCCGV